jgi:hypothetical protein
MRHAEVCLGEIPPRLKMRKAHASPRFEWRQQDSGTAGPRIDLFTEKKEVGKPGDFDHMADEELMEFIEAQREIVRELERQLLPPPAPKHREDATKR